MYELSVPAVGPQVSIYLPLQRSLPQARQSELSFQRAVEEAVGRLQACGLDATAIGRSRRQLESIPTSVREWEHPATTLAVLQNQAVLRAFPLVFAPPQRVSVGETFALRPLLRELQLNRCYHVLALSVNRVALFEGDAWGLQPLECAGLPASLKDALGSQLVGRELYQRTAPRPGAGSIYQGQGGAGEERWLDRERFYRAVAHGLAERLRGRDEPLVLAAGATHQGEFRQIAKLPQLLEEGLRGNADRLSLSDLHASTWSLVQDHIAAGDADSRVAYEHACKVRKEIDVLDDIAAAAVSGRVRRLWLELDRHMPGRVELDSGRIAEAAELHADVFDALALIVIRHRGEVRVVEPSYMPVQTGAFAELR